MSWFPGDLKGKEQCNIDINTGLLLNATTVLDGSARILTDDVTFMIPYGTDSQNRFENLCDVLIWIFANTTAKIHLYISESEVSLGKFTWFHFNETDNDKILKTLFRNICIHRLHYSEFHDQFDYDSYFEYFRSKIKLTYVKRANNELFHRTRYLNEMLATVDTPIVVNHDADVFISRTGLITALNYLRKSNVDCVYPYEYGRKQIQIFQRTGPDSIGVEHALVTGDISTLIDNLGHGTMMWTAKYGQTIFYKTESYIKMYGENEEFISWAPEDAERYVRALKFGLNIARTNGYVLHLEHPRGSDSSKSNPLFEKNEQLWDNLQKMNKEQLLEYYKNSNYPKKYGW